MTVWETSFLSAPTTTPNWITVSCSSTSEEFASSRDIQSIQSMSLTTTRRSTRRKADRDCSDGWRGDKDGRSGEGCKRSADARFTRCEPTLQEAHPDCPRSPAPAARQAAGPRYNQLVPA